MNKLNLTEQEKNRIRGLHNSHKNQHGTLIKEGPIGARYGQGFEGDMAEQTQPSPEDWKVFWTEAGNINQEELLKKFETCDEKTLADWWRKNTACSSKMNFMQDENCRTSFQEAVNLAGVLLCLGVNKISELGSTLKDMAAKGLGLGE
jgi:hypothetical protein